MGETLRFRLSLGLFSSFGIDSGTRLLLKTLAVRNIIPEEGSVLDAGYGTGVIAVSLKKRFPKLDVTAADLDALALRFTDINAKLNRLPSKGFKTAAGLLPGSLKAPVAGEPQKYDLIISNIPAKAGNPVIRDFLRNCGLHLNPGGRAAVVIVAPLADFAEKCLTGCGAEITYSEADKQYTVFHFIPPGDCRELSFPEIYCRTEGRVSGFYGLPEFDTVSYCTQVTLETLKSFGCTGKTLIWNPGTGHLTYGCNTAEEIILAGADLLQLKASDYNNGAGTAQHHLPLFSELPKAIKAPLDGIIAAPRFVSGCGEENEIIETSAELLRRKGRLLVAGKSSDISRVEKSKKGFSVRHSVKYRGFRALLLEKL